MLDLPGIKINIGLYITGKRKDGFHELKSIFYPVSYGDMVEITKSQGHTALHMSGIPVPGPGENNICLRAYELLDSSFDLPPLKIYLHKLIPAGSGLGGGSADGVSVLKLCNREFKLGLDDGQLSEYAEQLGSDCPFFVKETPTFVQGRGEVVAPSNVDLKGYSLVLIHKGIHISTGEAFKKADIGEPDIPLQELVKKPVEEWKVHMINSFEKSVFSEHPELKSVKDKLYAFGAAYAQMSGSGSTVYGLFKGPVKKEDFDFDPAETFVKTVEL